MEKPLIVDEVLDIIIMKLIEINENIELLEVRDRDYSPNAYYQIKHALITVAAIRECIGLGKEAGSLFPSQVS